MSLRGVSQLLYQIKVVNQEMIAKFEKETGFSLTRYELMMILDEVGTCSQTKIQSELMIDRAAVTRHLKILEDDGYVVRERNKDNNREVFVEMTEKAKEDLAKCGKDHEKSQYPLNSALTEMEEEQLSDLLSKLIKPKEGIE